MKQIIGLHHAHEQHWVGDGFPVRTLFSYQSMGEELSPFLMLDYASPTPFPSAATAKGVGAHPHRGFETVTIVYEGELAHKDSAGNSGTIGPGDVQWMTAGAGILHEEMHSKQFTQQGGMLSMAQLWVNLPAKQKMTPPGYQAIDNQTIQEIICKLGLPPLRSVIYKDPVVTSGVKEYPVITMKASARFFKKVLRASVPCACTPEISAHQNTMRQIRRHRMGCSIGVVLSRKYFEVMACRGRIMNPQYCRNYKAARLYSNPLSYRCEQLS